jgi:hypothetical protein
VVLLTLLVLCVLTWQMCDLLTSLELITACQRLYMVLMTLLVLCVLCCADLANVRPGNPCNGEESVVVDITT